jgi:hypothetical protein
MSLSQKNENVVVDEEDDNVIRCIHCKNEIVGKPWISVGCGHDEVVYACNYICSNRLSFYIGSGYWERVLNKEDFPGPRPVFHGKPRKDITVNFGIDEIRREIEEEDARIEALENYDSDESSNYEFMSP